MQSDNSEKSHTCIHNENGSIYFCRVPPNFKIIVLRQLYCNLCICRHAFKHNYLFMMLTYCDIFSVFSLASSVFTALLIPKLFKICPKYFVSQNAFFPHLDIAGWFQFLLHFQRGCKNQFMFCVSNIVAIKPLICSYKLHY